MPMFSNKVKSFFINLFSPATQSPRLRRKLFFYGGLVFVLILIEAGLSFFARPESESEKLRQLVGELTVLELQGNSLSLHYTLADPNAFGLSENFGLETDTVCLPFFSDTLWEEDKELYTALLNRLRSLGRESLSPHERFLSRILLHTLENTCESLSYPYYYEPLSPSSGEQTSLLILLAEYRFYDKTDVEHYLALLDCIPGYFDSLLSYEKQKAAAGLFMSDQAAENVIAQCDTLCTKETILQNSHFLQTTFADRLEELTATGIITREEAQVYIDRNRELLLYTVSPAYTTLADGIFLLKGSGQNENGLCFYERGTDYYQLLLTSLTGTGRTPEEILSLLHSQFAADYDRLISVAGTLNAMQISTSRLIPELPFETPEEMLEDLKVRMTEDFPALSDRVTYTISAVDEALSPYVSPAYYLMPAVDQYLQNQIYINYGDRYDSLTLYTTLAHEGYPGHLYQTVYHDMDMDENSLLPLEAMLSYGGYAEGWATYVEDLSYDYAAQVLTERCGYSEREAALLCDFYRLDRRIQLCLYSILDVSIHYYGMTREDAGLLLNAYGITNTEAQSWIYEYIVEEPANYLKYYLGYLEITALRDKAVSLWGESYSNIAFHTFLLKTGPAPFPLLEELLYENTAAYTSSAENLQ